MNEPTPFELLAAENEDLRAKLELAEERAFYQAARIARLEAELRAALSAQATKANHSNL